MVVFGNYVEKRKKRYESPVETLSDEERKMKDEYLQGLKLIIIDAPDKILSNERLVCHINKSIKDAFEKSISNELDKN
jgi:hypothetical protein